MLISGHVHLTKVARAISPGDADIHGIEKRLSRHLGSEHWDMSPLADELLTRSAGMVTDDTLITADLSDLNKQYARKMEGLGRVHDGSDPDGRIVAGYVFFEAYVRVGKWQLFPLVVEPLKTYSGAPTSENAEILRHVRRIHEATGGRGTWVLDRGFDRDELMLPWLNRRLGVRDPAAGGPARAVWRTGGVLAETAVAAEVRPPAWPRRWPKGGYTTCREVWLPEAPDQALLLVIHWRRPERRAAAAVWSARRPAGRAGGPSGS